VRTESLEIEFHVSPAYGDVGIAHSYSIWITRDCEGRALIERGGWTDVLLKQDGGWVWIADHGGARPD
jgi:hypothetical protein